MGILNVTPDSFYDGGHFIAQEQILQQADKMVQEGAAILDIGGASSRPGAATVPTEEELQRVLPVVQLLRERFPNTILSIDTWRATVAAAALEAGADIVNDISGAEMDADMLAVMREHQVPYILMHMQGQPNTMQQNPHYEDVVLEVTDFFVQKLEQLYANGVYDVILDPGFGFGKSVAHNYQLLQHLHVFKHTFGLPVLAGISRKSMICKPLGIKPESALNGTTALHMVALQQGAHILRAHDVREAMEVIQLWKQLVAVSS
jgi:dihydropteroate synthase